ncbi:DNA alkylation repair protein, partial [bacterium]|nr:DNA alkylation repair protein [bacterium]
VFLEEPKLVGGEQMEAWAAQFDSWALCDGACIHLFRRTAQAWDKALEWCGREDEYVKRAGFALAATLAVNDKAAPDERFLPLLEAVEREAGDSRNLVKKAVNWALRQIGKRNLGLNSQAIAAAHRIASQGGAAARWVAHDALRELTGRAVQERLGSRR